VHQAVVEAAERAEAEQPPQYQQAVLLPGGRDPLPAQQQQADHRHHQGTGEHYFLCGQSLAGELHQHAHHAEAERACDHVLQSRACSVP
jgi:hypothetical protein